jgi:hypothetical protein
MKYLHVLYARVDPAACKGKGRGEVGSGPSYHFTNQQVSKPVSEQTAPINTCKIDTVETSERIHGFRYEIILRIDRNCS